MNINFKHYLLTLLKAKDCEEVEVIQSLWSGYGKIERIRLEDSSFKSVIVKRISLDKANDHPRGWNTNFSHNRKVKSYQVETNWYKHWNIQTNNNCKTPQFLGAYSEGENQWIIMEDLARDFPICKHEVKLFEVKVCLSWLAHFHAQFLNKKPNKLWRIGTYWHLDTRPDEFEKIENKELKEKAYLIDEKLNQCKYKTIVHGDAKLANFCFSEDSNKVAAVDFQYVGGGCGIKDVAYFLGSCQSSDQCEKHEQELLDYYFEILKKSLSKHGIHANQLEQEWRELFPFACADFTRFKLGWMPTHQKLNSYSLDKLSYVLSQL